MAGPEEKPEKKRELALLLWIQQYAPYGVVTLDESFRVQTWNRWMETHGNLLLNDVIGKSLLELFPELVDRRLLAPLERALAGESSVLATALHHHFLPLASPTVAGTTGPMRQTARIAPMLSDGVVCGIVIVIEDVTQREDQADALGRQHRRDEILSWALAHLLKSETPRKTVRQLFFKIAEHLDFDTFLLYLRDVETGVLGLYTAGGVTPDAELALVQHPMLGSLANERDIAIFNSIETRPEPEFEAFRKAHLSALIALPLFADERSLGLVCFGTASRESIAADESTLLGTIAQYLATAVDRENTSQRLEKAQEQLIENAELLEAKISERTSRLHDTISELESFSYILAHDLNAPVRGMIGYSQALLDDYGHVLPPEALFFAQRLARTPRRMAALIKDMLQFSEVSRQEIILTKVEIETVMEEILALRAPEVRRAVTMQTPLHPVMANKTLLGHVLSNLVDNAVKFVVPGKEPKILIFTESVSQMSPRTRGTPLLLSSLDTSHYRNNMPGSRARPAGIRIWVADEGIGIAPEAQQKIFGIFERVCSPDQYEGTGMGLAIVARAMQRMTGSYGVESQQGKGSRFWIELPALEVPPLETKNPAPD